MTPPGGPIDNGACEWTRPPAAPGLAPIGCADPAAFVLTRLGHFVRLRVCWRHGMELVEQHVDDVYDRHGLVHLELR